MRIYQSWNKRPWIPRPISRLISAFVSGECRKEDYSRISQSHDRRCPTRQFEKWRLQPIELPREMKSADPRSLWGRIGEVYKSGP